MANFAVTHRSAIVREKHTPLGMHWDYLYLTIITSRYTCIGILTRKYRYFNYIFINGRTWSCHFRSQDENSIKLYFRFNLGVQMLSERSDAHVNRIIIGSGYGLSPVRCQAITWTNAELFKWNGRLRTKLSEIWIKLPRVSLKKRMW